jgi:hypothetical protein
MSTRESSSGGRRRLSRAVAGLCVGVGGLLSALIAGVFAAIAINPGYDRNWSFLVGDAVAVPVAFMLLAWSARLVGASRVPARVLAGLVLCVGIGLMFVGGFEQRPDRRADEAKNLRFLGTLRRVPGSIPTRHASFKLRPSGDMFDEGFLNPSPGYGTVVTFLLPPSTTLRQGAAFYRREFGRHGWPVQEYDTDCTGVRGRNAPSCGLNIAARLHMREIVDVLVYPRADGRVEAKVERDP